MLKTLQVRRLGYALGAAVGGVDLREPLGADGVAEIRRLWLEHLLLCFPGQDLTKEQLVAFVSCFGDVDSNETSKTRDPDSAHIFLLTNKPIGDRPWDGYKEGQSWHSDRSIRVTPSLGTFVLAKEVPDSGGDTMFANQYMAYDALSPTLKQIVAPLSAVHDHSKVKGADRQAPEVLARLRLTQPPVAQPVVALHPETGRKALYVGERVRNVVGMTEEESRPLIDVLLAHAVKHEFTYRHKWRAQDLVMWDNRCLLHIALSDYDVVRQTRHLWRVSLQGATTGRAV